MKSIRALVPIAFLALAVVITGCSRSHSEEEIQGYAQGYASKGIVSNADVEIFELRDTGGMGASLGT
jgi:hypothetical protein